MPMWRKTIRMIKGKRRQVKVARVRGKEFVRVSKFRNYTDKGRIKSRR